MKFYRGIVVNNKDPKVGGRVQVRIFELHGMPETCSESEYQVFDGNQDSNVSNITNDHLPWAEVIQPIDFIGFFNTNHYDKNEQPKKVINGKGSKSQKSRRLRKKSGDHNDGFGQNRILEIGTWVFCVLENDNPNFPIVLGTISSNNEYSELTNPTSKRFYQSTSGHFEDWNDTPGEENIIIHHRTGSEFELEPNGDIEVQSSKDYKHYVMKNSLIQVDGFENKRVDNDKIQSIGGDSITTASKNIIFTGQMIYLN